MTEEKTVLSSDFIKAYSALKLDIGSLKKDGKNPHFKSEYATLNQVLDVVGKACETHKFVFMQNLGFEGSTPCLVTRLINESGEFTESKVPIISKDPNDPQKFGGGITYMRRYSLVTMFGLRDDDDDGNKASSPKKKETLNEKHPKWEGAKTSVANGEIDLAGLRKHFTISDEDFDKLSE